MTRRQAQAIARRSQIKEFVVVTLFALLTTIIVINWMTGCGTFTRTPEGRIIHGSCVFIPSFAIHTPTTPQ